MVNINKLSEMLKSVVGEFNAEVLSGGNIHFTTKYATINICIESGKYLLEAWDGRGRKCEEWKRKESTIIEAVKDLGGSL